MFYESHSKYLLGVLMSQTVASRLCLWKIPLDGQRWGLPDLTPQMSDCCRQHPCRRINGKSAITCSDFK